MRNLAVAWVCLICVVQLAQQGKTWRIHPSNQLRCPLTLRPSYLTGQTSQWRPARHTDISMQQNEVSRRSLLSLLGASAVAASDLTPRAPLGLTDEGMLQPCPRTIGTQEGCISSTSTSPTQWLASLRYEQSREAAFNRLKAVLKSESDVLKVEGESPDWVHAATADEDIEFHFYEKSDGPLVEFRVLSRKPRLTPPFCITRGCINGNGKERQRLVRLKQALGWQSDYGDSRYEQDSYDNWVPIFFH